MAKKPTFSINNQHDYITLRTPYGNLTVSRYGAKVSGQLTQIPGLISRFDKFVGDHSTGENIGQRVERFMREFDTLVPEVGNLKPVATFKVGQKVKGADAIFRKEYPSVYEVLKVNPKTVVIRVTDSNRSSIPYRLTVDKFMVEPA